MNDECFNKCRAFLEAQISENPENKDLICTYQKLIELKSTHDTSVHANNTNLSMNANNTLATYHTNSTNLGMNANAAWIEMAKISYLAQAGVTPPPRSLGEFQG